MRAEQQSGHGEPISFLGLARTLEGMVQRLAAHPGRHISFYAADGRVTRKRFPEVLADVEQVRARLQLYGLRPGMRVGIFASNSYEWLVHDLALIQLGVTSIPFPDETPVADLAGKFERYRLSLLLASSDLLPAYPLKQPVAFLDGTPSGPIMIRPFEASPGEPRDPSIVFSSGSSGRLKALRIDGPGSLEVIESFCSRYRLYEDDLFYVFLPLHSWQTRIMIFGCINFGVSFALVKTSQLLAGLREFRPTLCLSPPLLFDSVKKQFEEALRGQPAWRWALFHAARSLSRVAPLGMKERLRDVCYGRLRETFGGRMRMMWTGMAPVRPATLEFFAEAGIRVLEAYGLTECGPITGNTLEENRIGSVGQPIVPGSVRLAEDGEVIVERVAMFSSGYFEADAADEAATYLGPGRIATGDIGELDADGFLYLKGRKKEIIITSGGHKVHPEIIEGHLERSPLVLQAVVFGQGLPYLTAVIVARDPGRDRQALEEWVAEVQRNLPYDVRIERLHFTAEEFSTANGLLTENLKVHRKAVFQRYCDQLAQPRTSTRLEA